jgi:hypothetical protein
MKPGYKTTEFWITIIVQLLNGLIQCGLIGAGTTLKVVSFASAALNALVYAIARAHVKSFDDADAQAGAKRRPTTATTPEGGFVKFELSLLLVLALLGMDRADRVHVAALDRQGGRARRSTARRARPPMP